MSSHSKAAKRFVADAERMAWHDRALYAVREKRDRMAHSVPEWESLRETASAIKRHTLSRLGHYLELFERNATANGIEVHWAEDAAEMNATVWRLVQEHGGQNLIKSKSMLSEECGLTPYLRERGVDAVESDLGERIMQLLKLPPSHIVLPAIGVRREEVGALFTREMGTEPGNSDPTYLTHAARRNLRAKFLGADISMTGVNFAVAETGALAVCTNEGNADLGTSFCDLHIAIMGLEKVIPDMRSLGVFTRLLARSGTGQPVTTSTSLYRRPAPGKPGLSPFGRILLLLLHPRTAGHQPLDAALAQAPPRQRLGLLALLLLLARLPGENRPGRTNLPLAPAARPRPSGRPRQEGGRQGDGCHHARAALRIHWLKTYL